MDARLTVFVVVFGVVAILGFAASRWRRPDKIHSLEEWGLGGRAFGNWVTFFLLSGDVYTAYTFVAVPTLVFGVGASGFFPVPFLIIVYPMLFVVLARFWSVCHVHGFVTPAEFVRARFGSRGLGKIVAVLGIVATMPYIALQLIGIEAVFEVMGLPKGWPLTVAFVVLALYTFNSGLRAPALVSIVKDALVLWAVLAAVLIVSMVPGSWEPVFQAAEAKFAASARTDDGLLLAPQSQLNYVTLALGSAVALFLYPHTLTGVLAARNRGTLRRNLAVLPIYTLTLGILMLVGFAAIYSGTQPVGGNGNTVVPQWFDGNAPAWTAGLVFAAIGVGAMVPAAIMSIAAANLFTRDIYRQYFRPNASDREETYVSKTASLTVKFGALLVILLLNTQFAIDLQLIGGVVIMQTLPAVALGLYTSWFHRGALVTGVFAGLVTGLVMLYQVPKLGGPDGRTVVREHFGGSAWPLDTIGIDSNASIYVGVVALAVNLLVTVMLTGLLRGFGVPGGPDRTRDQDYVADEGDPTIRRMTEIIDGQPAPSSYFEPRQAPVTGR
ncbi:sodium:solute symporter family protein [Actinoplanes couchii]|uniref:Solute:Na+ symporter, SSS family protein n=1 Tax=Actinoplanes couchii TaxID=403638 RepID=A0ABQ3XC62_9ACTN|nr:sodium:solute symporter [Actinoplanes couchii]MDR6323576.1 SSS family solute:Na+ symporter [Actinoplanes couchii]GID56093.1 solute:Na+ symporter, SSS family protein [Actinoplanes couchii]